MEDNSIFAEVPREGENVEDILNSVDKGLQEENPAESQTEKTVDEPDLKQNEAWKKMREEKEASDEKARKLEEKLSEIEKVWDIKEKVEQPEFLTDMIGENEDVAKKFQNYESGLKEKIKAELIQDQIDAQNKVREDAEKWTNWTNDRLSEVETDFKVNFKSDPSLKNELSKIMTDYTPTDEQGNLDFKKGMKLLTDLKKVQEAEQSHKVQVKKDIADATVSKETSIKPNKDYMTSNDMRGRDWRSLMKE